MERYFPYYPVLNTPCTALPPYADAPGERHAWIVKPAGRARGEGIQILTDLDTILRWTTKRRQCGWVCQKYIERPLVMEKRKYPGEARKGTDLGLCTVLRPLRFVFH